MRVPLAALVTAIALTSFSEAGMNHRSKLLPMAIALTLASAHASAADFGDKVSVRGFGTVGVMHSTEDQADVVGSVFQPTGAGYSHDWDMRPDSKFATQADIAFTDKLSLTLQALSQYRYDHSFTPQMEWANLKYKFTPNFSARIGRIALPTFLVSESRMVGFANSWVRPPEELYQSGSITNSDGADISYSVNAGGMRHSMQAIYGVSKTKLEVGDVKADHIWGANYVLEKGDLTARVGFIAMELDLEVAQSAQLPNGIAAFGAAAGAFGFATTAAEAARLANKYSVEGIELTFLSVGLSYDPGAWFAMMEALEFGGDSMLSDSRSGHVTGGIRLGKFTPYAILAMAKADIEFEPGFTTAGLPAPLAFGAAALNAGMNEAKRQSLGSQESAALGLRWDVINNVAVKAQYNYVDIGENSRGRLFNVQPGFELGSNYSLYSLSVDYIF